MQLFYLLSFVAAVSHAAALPQPAGLSDKYSSNVDITFASFLGARSYQPVLNSKEDSATLVSLKRRADSDGASGKPRRSSPPPSPLLTPEDVEKIIAKFFKDSDFTSANISSTIDKVGDGAVDFYKDGERAGKEIGGTAGPMLKRYLDRDIYEGEVVKAVSNILTKTGTVIENVNTINTSFKDLFDSRMKLFTLLGSPLKDSEAGKILYGHISNVVTSLGKFVADQQKIHDDIIKALGPPPPK
ncbi:hypothetical protein BASA83_002655 [Batrachochytrium salamandrivorans]|nr:hypothetical protein BASA83_002655 [Batrachochytrium salamandrivorans]